MQSCRFFVVVLVVMEHFYHLFACHQIKKKLPRSFKMGSKMCAPYITYLYYRKKFLATGTGLITKLTTIQACSTTSWSVYCSSISTSLSFGFRQWAAHAKRPLLSYLQLDTWVHLYQMLLQPNSIHLPPLPPFSVKFII